MAIARRRLAAGRATEIVSCDSMQVYRGMDIGTAKATSAEREAVRHHLIDIVDPTEEFSVADFWPLVTEALDDIEGRGSSAILVGGTGLYVRSVTDVMEMPPRYPDVAAELESEPDSAVLLHRLSELDPVAASRIPIGNRRRIVRALEVTLGSGVPFSDSGPGMDVYEPTPFALAGLRVPRDVLRLRIEARLHAQMAEGFLDEARRLATLPGGASRTAVRALGYQELLIHLRGEIDLDGAVDAAIVNTGRFAVRQERWFRRDPRITWFAPEVDGTGPNDHSTAVAAAIDDWWAESAAARRGSTTTVAPGRSDATDATDPTPPDRTT